MEMACHMLGHSVSHTGTCPGSMAVAEVFGLKLELDNVSTSFL